MKTLFLIFVLSCSAWAATPTVAQVNTTVHCASSSTCASNSLTTTTGHTVAVACQNGSQAATFSVSDATNTYTAVGTGTTNTAAEGASEWFVAKNITGVAHVITCTITGAVSTFTSIYVYDIAGASATTPVDVPSSATAGGTSGTSATPSFTLPVTTNSNDLLLFAFSCGNTCAAGTGTTNTISDANGDLSEAYSKSATGTYTGSATQTSGAFIAIGVAISDGAGGGGGSVAIGIDKRRKLQKLGVL